MEFMKLIRQKSMTLHQAAENSGFLKRLLNGNADVSSYSEYLYNLCAVYEAIEQSLESCQEVEALKPFITPELYRTSKIKQDLDYLVPNHSLTLLASTEAYISRIHEVAANTPELIIPHAYTRFLADLFGGRTLATLMVETYKISNEGLNYYEFDELEDIRAYVMTYHHKLGALALDETLKQAFLNEVSNAYIYNLAISEELEVKRYSNQ